MELYTERHDLRKPIERTYEMSKEAYSLLLDTCKKYYKNLTHKFTLSKKCSFTHEPYIEFDNDQFENRMAIQIPDLFKDEGRHIATPKEYDIYDQYSLLDLIEYIANNMKDISERWNSIQYKNYWIINCLETTNVFNDFKEEINEIFRKAGLLFELTEGKIIERIVEHTILSPEKEKQIKQVSEIGTRELLEEAMTLYKTPNVSEQRIAVEKIWDALERLKTYYVNSNRDKKESIDMIIRDMSNGQQEFFKLFDSEFKALTCIGNKYRIRHHEKNQIDITDDRHYDYLFERCFSLIALAIKYLK